MSKVLSTISKVAAVVATVAAIAGNPLIAAIATAVSLTAGVAAQITAPKPVARGGATNVLIDTEPPRPYMVGESYSAGILRHRVGYGATLKKVPNPYLWEVKVFSGVGPVEALVSELFDFTAIGSYYTGWYSSVSQLGLRPESAALVPPFGAATGWTTAHKLSGCAAIGGNYKFDRDGKVFASGTPVHGAIWQGEKVYDPRLDDTYPGGEGDHRLGDETTYEYNANPALHAGTYAYGRFQNGIKVFGLGVSSDGIDWAAIVDWANDCDANDWECHGTLYEGGRGADVQRQRVQNLDDLCAAGGGRWLTAGALLSFDWQRPRVSLATMTDDDILQEGANATAVQALRDRMNGVRPQYVSPTHNWEQITADEIVGSTYRTEDGQPLTQTWALNLVKDAAQAGELASYAMVDSREIGPIELSAKAKWRFYKPGETITLNSDLLGYSGQAVIAQRDFDPQTLAVRLTLKGETPAKHDFALGKTATPPPTPVIGQTQEQRDGVTGETVLNPGEVVFSDIPALQVAADTAGVTTTTLPITRQLVITQNGASLASTATWSIVTSTAGITATVNTSGVLSLDVANVTGSITVRAVVGGVNYDKVAAVTRTISSGTSGGGSGATTFSDGSWINTSSTSFAQVTDAGAIVQSDGSGEIQFTASASYYAASGVQIKAQTSPDNSTWTDVGVAVDGTNLSIPGEPDFISLSQTATGLTVSTDYYVRLVAKLATSGGSIEWVSPAFTAKQP